MSLASKVHHLFHAWHAQLQSSLSSFTSDLTLEFGSALEVYDRLKDFLFILELATGGSTVEFSVDLTRSRFIRRFQIWSPAAGL